MLVVPDHIAALKATLSQPHLHSIYMLVCSLVEGSSESVLEHQLIGQSASEQSV